MFKILDGREHFYQWDINRKLIVNDETIKEVHFCNRSGECSLVCEVYNENGLNVVDVPNIILQKSYCINVYAYDGEATKYSKTFIVKPRTKPEDYVYTETEIKKYDDIKDFAVELCEEVRKNTRKRYFINNSGLFGKTSFATVTNLNGNIANFSIRFPIAYLGNTNTIQRKVNIPFNIDLLPVGLDPALVTNIQDFKLFIKNSLIGNGEYSLDYIAYLLSEYYDSYNIAYSSFNNASYLYVRYDLNFVCASSSIASSLRGQFMGVWSSITDIMIEHTQAEYIETVVN